MTDKLFCLIEVFSMTLLLFFGGCLGATQDKAMKEQTSNFTKAVVSLRVDEQNQPIDKTKEITDETEVLHLASFFPGLGEGKRSRVAALWEPTVEIHFTGADGKGVTVMSNFESWSEGKGDWPVKPGLKQYIRKLLAEFPETP